MEKVEQQDKMLQTAAEGILRSYQKVHSLNDKRTQRKTMGNIAKCVQQN